MANSYPSDGPLTLRTHIAERANTTALLTGAARSPLVALDICGPAGSASKGFKPLVREGAFEVSELSVMTYLQAKAYGKPLVLVPAVLLARFQHHLLGVTKESELRPQDLAGKRVGIRSYTVTTAAWARAILELQYAVDITTIKWVSSEEPHLVEYRDPPNVERIKIAEGGSMEQMLLDGEIDAIVAARKLDDRLRPLIPDAEAAGRQWYEKFGVLQLNHMLVVNAGLSHERPDVVAAIYGMLKDAKEAMPKRDSYVDFLPFGVENNRGNLEMAIRCAHSQGLIPRLFEVDELFDDTTRRLN